MLATLLDKRHTPRLRTFLERDVPGNIFTLSILQKWGIDGLQGAEWWGVFNASDLLVGACYVGAKTEATGLGLAVPFGEPEATHLIGLTLATRGRVHWVVGDRSASDALWLGLGNPTSRLQTDQTLYELTSLCPGQTIDIRNARDAEFEWVHQAASAMVEEDLSLPWAGQSPEQFASRIRTGIREGAEYVGMVANRLIYRAELGIQGTHGTQIGGIWVDPDFRGRGMGQAGTRALCALLLSRVPRVTMHVRADNATAIRCYTSIGFEAIRDFRLLVR